MSTQPDALRIADNLREFASEAHADYHVEVIHEAAVKLRRLHEVNQQLLDALKLALSICVARGEPDAEITKAIIVAQGESA